MEWSEIAEQIEGLAHLATADAEGTPHASVVMGFVDGEHVWIATAMSSRKAQNLAQNPRISIMWQPEAEIYVNGDVQLIDDMEQKRRVWDGGLLPYDPERFFGTVDNPDLVLLKITPTTAIVQMVGPGGGSVERWSAN